MVGNKMKTRKDLDLGRIYNLIENEVETEVKASLGQDINGIAKYGRKVLRLINQILKNESKRG
jgi:hypothetical protein